MKCCVEGCENSHRAKGFCAIHYARVKRRGTTDLPKYTQAKCLREGCNIVTTSRTGFCITHYKQNHYLKAVGRDVITERISQERWINSQTCYVMVKKDGKLTYEHIVLAEQALGKPLPIGAIVHHTGAKDDNHGYCKLIVCPDQAYHFLIHRRMREFGYENNQD